MPNKGYKHSAEALAKISEASKNRWKNSKYREAVIKTRIGSKRSEETKKRMSTAQKNRTYGLLSEEHKKNIGKAMTGRVMSDETKSKMSESATGPNSSQWQGGISLEIYPTEFNNELKESIRERDNYTCRVCSKTEIVVKRKLDVHHIDYDKMNCADDNLIALCHSCNTKANANRNEWTEYFQNKMLLVERSRNEKVRCAL